MSELEPHDKAQQIGEQALVARLDMVRFVVKSFIALLCLAIVSGFIVGFNFVTLFAQLFAAGFTVYVFRRHLEFKRTRHWQLYKGTFVFLGYEAHEELTIWINENVPEDESYSFFNDSRMMVFKDPKMATMVKLMVRKT